MALDAEKIRTVLFDLDGTLIDNFTAIHRCYSDVAKTMGLVPKSLAAIRAAVGSARERKKCRGASRSGNIPRPCFRRWAPFPRKR